MKPPLHAGTALDGRFTLFGFADHVEVLIRSADWYDLPPISRYLHNMCANEIRMEDAKTETRIYDWSRFLELVRTHALSLSDEYAAAHRAWTAYGNPAPEFGVIHIEQKGPHKGNVLVGDDPDDVFEFAPCDDGDSSPAEVTLPHDDLDGNHL